MPKRIETQPHRRNDANEYQAHYRETHREEMNAYYRDYHAKHKADPEYQSARNVSARWSRRKAKYGLTREAYEAMAQAQEGLCAICGVTPDHDLRVDHDHETEKVRALLCNGCNAGLGMFQENPNRLQAAIKYLRRHIE